MILWRGLSVISTKISRYVVITLDSALIEVEKGTKIMDPQNERRRWPRADLTPPEVGILYSGNSGSEFQSVLGNPADKLFVDLCNKAEELGVVLKATDFKDV